MQKTKLGISVGMLGALLYFAGLFGGYVITIVVAGYVLLVEDNAWLRKTSVKAVALMIGFSLLFTVINFIPNAIELINNACNIFDGHFSIKVINSICTFLHELVNYTETVLFLVLGFKAFHQGSITIPLIDKAINKYM